jgi:hypothetical protein
MHHDQRFETATIGFLAPPAYWQIRPADGNEFVGAFKFPYREHFVMFADFPRAAGVKKPLIQVPPMPHSGTKRIWASMHGAYDALQRLRIAHKALFNGASMPAPVPEFRYLDIRSGIRIGERAENIWIV